MKIKGIIILCLIVAVFLIFYLNPFKVKDIKQMSPKEIMALYLKSREKGDIEMLKKIIYFSPEISEDEKNSKVRLAITGADEKTAMSMTMAGIKAECEKIIDVDTAEVGLVITTGIVGVGRRPFIEIVMKKDQGVWKYNYDKYSLTEKQWIDKIRQNPKDASAYYYLGRLYQHENPARANRYYKKYYEIEPEGFWVNAHFKNNLKEYDDIEEEERKMLADVESLPPKSPNRATDYTYLGQLFTEHGDYQKAQVYFGKSEDILKFNRVPLEVEALEKAKKELELRMSGQSYDILDEINSGR